MQIFAYYQDGFEGAAAPIQVCPSASSLDILGYGQRQNRQFCEKATILFSLLGKGKPRGIVQPATRIPLERIELAILLSLLLDGDRIASSGGPNLLIMGQVRLDGSLCGCNSLLDAPEVARRNGCTLLVAPDGNPVHPTDSLSVRTPKTLREAYGACCRHLATASPPLSYEQEPRQPSQKLADPFCGVIGLEPARQAMAIAAAGRLNILLYGPPGSGKTMLLQRFPLLLPPLSERQRTEVELITNTRQDDIPVLSVCPDTSAKDLLGGTPPRICRAHQGVMVLDEIPEQKQRTLLGIRTVMDRKIVGPYPCDMVVVAAMNACPCGNLGRKGGICKCTERQIESYWARIGAPLLDRFDMTVPVTTENLLVGRIVADTHDIKERILHARRTIERKTEEDFRKLLPLLSRSTGKSQPSIRSAISACKIACIIADFEGRKRPTEQDFRRAMGYKTHGPENPYWQPL
jgi:magnesium chelatase family protein